MLKLLGSPHTPVYKAITYTLNSFNALVKYTSDGMLSIDNNVLEGQIRSIALGRLNHVFAGSHIAEDISAVNFLPVKFFRYKMPGH